MQGQKHLIKCRCILPQFKKMIDPPFHQFIVFSIIDDNDHVKPKLAICPNCGAVHKVIEISKSEITTKESAKSILTIEDIKQSLPTNISSILEKNDVDLPTWEMAQFIYENKRWGEFVVLSTEHDDDLKQGKYLTILGESLIKIETFSREESLK